MPFCIVTITYTVFLLMSKPFAVCHTVALWPARFFLLSKYHIDISSPLAGMPMSFLTSLLTCIKGNAFLINQCYNSIVNNRVTVSTCRTLMRKGGT